MRKASHIFLVFGLTLFWFLVLPFPFEHRLFPNFYGINAMATQWRTFGGYHLLDRRPHARILFYSHTYYLIIFLVVSALLGVASYRVIQFLRQKNSHPQDENDQA